MSTAMYREFTVLCDHPGCEEAFGPFGVDRSRAELRKLAGKAGWTHVHTEGLPRSRDEDYCPAHKPAGAS